MRDIQHHLARTLGTELSHETISTMTDAVAEEVKAWQTRPLEEVYPIIYLDALVVKVRDGGVARNKSAHIAVGVDLEGVEHVLGIWVQNAEGARFWAQVCTELRNRGVRDVLFVCCAGLPEAIEATWRLTSVQTCVVHLIRASMRFVSYADRKPVARAPEAGLHGSDSRRGRDRVAGVRRLRARAPVPGGDLDLAVSVGAVHPVPGVPTRGPEDHLYDQQHPAPTWWSAPSPRACPTP